MQTEKVIVKPTYSPEYPVIIGLDVVDKVSDLLEEEIDNIDKIVIFVQHPVNEFEMYERLVKNLSEKFEVYTRNVPSGEIAKSLEYALQCIEFLHNIQATRATTVIGIGGGALGDLVGFISSIYLRGLPLVLVPTTLLSMVDSAIGGKNAINMFNIKNVVGTFYQPKIVIEELNFLKYLPEREIRSGLAEVVKYGITINPQIIKLIQEDHDSIVTVKDFEIIKELIKLSVECKAWIVNLDEREEKDIRQILNYGHTVGHGIEACAKGELTHGECVMIGMVVESELGARLGYTDRSVCEILQNIAKILRLPYKIPKNISKDDILKKIEYDKKRVGTFIKLPIVRRLGEFEIVSMEIGKLLGYLNNLLDEYYE